MAYVSLCLHTESLHDERVWRRLQTALDLLDEKGLRATFLVYPGRSLSAGADVRARVRELAARGHEVGQHTHFYLGTATERPHKLCELSDKNVRGCIRRDYEWLRGCGIEPVGFCAGNFLTTEAVFETLAELNFLYDCSLRLPWERTSYELPHSFAAEARVRDVGGRPLVLLPHTEYLTIAQLLSPSRRDRSARLAGRAESYQLIVNHDYDLLAGKVWLGLRWRARRGPRTVETRRLAELCLEGARA
jgi:hypothetical protein